jgi:hypothetical protein
MVARLLFGIPADVAWRLEHRNRGQDRHAPGRRPVMSTKSIALAAFIGGVDWIVMLLVMGVRGGDAAWYDPSTGWIMMVTTLLGVFGLAAAVVGLVTAYQDTLRGPIAATAAVAAVIGAISIFGPYGLILALPVGSGLLVWELRRTRVFRTLLTWSHLVASALSIVIVIIASRNPPYFATGSLGSLALTGVLALYGLSWISIGWTLLRVVGVRREPA